MALENIQQRLPQDAQWFKNYYHYVIYALMSLFTILILLISIMYYVVYNRPIPSFSAVNPDNVVRPLNAYKQPNLLPETILRWASKAATVAYTFDFNNYNLQKEMARPYFTPDGWVDYSNSVDGLIQEIIQNRLFVNGVVSGPPIFSNQGEMTGKGYLWRVQIPFLVTYQSDQSQLITNFIVSLTIIRVPTAVNPQGIGIDQFVMSRVS